MRPSLAARVALPCLLIVACASQPEPKKERDPRDYTPPAAGHESPRVVLEPTPADADPHISRSAGFPGAIVVLYPRVVPVTREDELRPVAVGVQQRLSDLVLKALPGRKIDLRPFPERACPQSGCTVPAMGAVLASVGTGCAVVVTLSPPGRSDSTLRPWAGEVEFKGGPVPFREAPESRITVKDMAICADLAATGAAKEAELIHAIRAAFGP
ncbi:MAG: hypothetical protein R3F39_00955 [Myxococcota bacterium]